MILNANYILVKKVEEPVKEGEFKTVEIQDSFIYKGEVVEIPSCPLYICDQAIKVGDIVIFTKYSPNAFDVDLPAGKRKFLNKDDVLAIV